jgi:flagella basal body P-ring formation protein FlgA
MDAAGACIAAAAVALGIGPSASGIDCASESHVRVNDEGSLMDSLLDFTQRRLRVVGLSVDRQHAQMTLSGARVPKGVFEIQARWTMRSDVPLQPLRFELRPLAEASGAAGGVREVFLAAPLLRDTAVTVRRLRKGTPFSCDDVRVEPRPLRVAPRPLLALPCQAGAADAVLRDLGPGEAVRADDLGMPYDVAAGSAVVMTVAVRGIEVTASATALADARTGDRVDLRLRHPVRTLPARVTGPGTAQLLQGNLQ